MATTTNNAGYLNLVVHHLNARLFNRLLADDGRALYNAEQGKILSALWLEHPRSATEISKITGLANSTLTVMLKRLEEQGLIVSVQAEDDKRKKLFDLTELGAAQEQVGDDVSRKLDEIFFEDFKHEEKVMLESLLTKVRDNLATAMDDMPRKNG